MDLSHVFGSTCGFWPFSCLRKHIYTHFLMVASFASYWQPLTCQRSFERRGVTGYWSMATDFPIVRSRLSGPQVHLRAPKSTDKTARLHAGNHPEFLKMLGLPESHAAALTEDRAQEWYARIDSNPFAWIIEVDGRCVGAAHLHALDQQNRRVRYAVALFDRAVWNQGIGTEVTRLVLWYAFEFLHLHRVELRVLEYNRAGIRAYEKAGFQREGLERETVLVGDAWYGDVIMGVLEAEFQQACRSWPGRTSQFRIT